MHAVTGLFWVSQSQCIGAKAECKPGDRLVFMSATDEELDFVHDNGMDHVTYILIMFRYGLPTWH
jgi:hypothetical protein